MLIDAAHNPAGAAALASYLQDTGSAKLPIVFAAMADKDLAGMIAALAPVASMFVATTVPHARARAADAAGGGDSRSMPPRCPVDAIAVTRGGGRARARTVAARGGAGSIYMVGPLRARLIAAGAAAIG